MAKILSIFDNKGGVGKTTTAASLGGILANEFGQRVLLVDIDAQMNLTQTFIDETAVTGDVCELFRVLETRRLPASLPITHIRENLDIIPSSEKISSLDITYAAVVGREYALKKTLALVAGDYDWIIIDSPAQIGVPTSNALTAADYLVVPITCDGFSVSGLKQTLNLVSEVQFCSNPDLKTLGFLKTRFNRRRIVDGVVEEQIQANFGDMMFATSIRECTALTQASFSRQDIITWDRESNAAADYISFTKELLDRSK